MALIKTTDEIKAFMPFAITFKIADITPFINQVEYEIIIPLISKAQYDALQTAYDANSLNADQTKLINKVRAVITPFALLRWIPWGQVQINSSGIQIVSNETNKTAFSWQVQDLKQNSEMSGYTAMESLYRFLYDNKATYTVWWDSTERKYLMRSFINTAAEFSIYFNISSNRKTFERLRDIITHIEKNYIKPILCDELFTQIKEEIVADSISDNNKKLMEFIRPAVCYLAISKGTQRLNFAFDDQNGISIQSSGTGNAKSENPLSVFNREKLDVLKNDTEKDGMVELEKLRQYLYDNVDTYTLFKNSDCYNSLGSSSQVDNKSDSGLYYL